MQRLLINLLVGIVCELIGLFVLWIFVDVMKSNIIELGYRSQKLRYKKEKNNLPLWDRMIHWSLCKNAKINTKIVWLYFIMNLYLVMVSVCSAVSLVVFILCFETKQLLLYQLQFLFYPLFPWGIVLFFLDIFLLPSEQKRYGLENKHKK